MLFNTNALSFFRNLSLSFILPQFSHAYQLTKHFAHIYQALKMLRAYYMVAVWSSEI